MGMISPSLYTPVRTTMLTLLYLLSIVTLELKINIRGVDLSHYSYIRLSKALVLYEIRRVSIEVQEYRSIVRNEGND